MAEARYQDVRRDKDLIPYVIDAMPQREFGDVQFDGELVFGNGEDGDVTISADTSLTEDMYYNNLTIDAGKTLNPNGWRVFVKNTLTLNGDLGIKESVGSVTAGSLAGTVAAGQNVVDGLGGAGEPDGYVPGYTFSGSGSVTSSVGVTESDFYDLRAAINGYQRRGSDFVRLKGGAGGGTGAEGVDGAGADGSWPPNATSVGSPGGKGSAGTGGSGGGGGRGGGVVMLAARVITGTGGLYSEGGSGVAGTAGTDGTPAPSYTSPASTSHAEGAPVSGVYADTGGEHHTEAVPQFSPGTGPPHDSFHHVLTWTGEPMWLYGTLLPGHASEWDPVEEHEEGQPIQVENPDVLVDFFEEGEAWTAEGAPVQTHVPATLYPGGAGGTGYTGQRGGRGGGGVLIVVTRDAGTPAYTFNTGVNGRVIALDTANI
tara:strand:+ start:160 stop:1443 length:1284 start_codon:yes stop_codon:yes gene_type:complete